MAIHHFCCVLLYTCLHYIFKICGWNTIDLLIEEEKQGIDVQFEAAAIQEQRGLQDENLSGNQNKDEDKTLQIADQFDSTSNNQGRFRLNFFGSQTKRIRQTIIRELSNRAMMWIPEAKSVKDVWKLKINDRWRLYRRWITHLSSRFRDAVTRYMTNLCWDNRPFYSNVLITVSNFKFQESKTVRVECARTQGGSQPCRLRDT